MAVFTFKRSLSEWDLVTTKVASKARSFALARNLFFGSLALEHGLKNHVDIAVDYIGGEATPLEIGLQFSRGHTLLELLIDMLNRLLRGSIAR